jgi:hypothetical protein
VFRTLQFGALDELARYLASMPEDVKNEDVLKWWYEHKHVYPNLHRMALDYHTVPCKFPVSLSFWYAYLTIYAHKQVAPSTSSESSVKAACSYPTFAIDFLQSQHAHSSALVSGAGAVS